MTDDRQNKIESAAKKFIGNALWFNENIDMDQASIILSVSRMSGLLIFKSFNFPENLGKPGQTFFSDKANEVGPALMRQMLSVLDTLGNKVEENDLKSEYMSSDGKVSYLESFNVFAPPFLIYCEKSSTNFQDAAFGAAVAAGYLVSQFHDVIPVDQGAALATFGFVEGTKTIPYSLENK